MKYFFRILFIVGLAFGLSACSNILVPDVPETDEVPVLVTFSLADKAIQTKSKVSGTEEVVHTMQLVCFDANGQYLGIRNAEVTSKGKSGTFFDTGVISGTVPQGTARIHFIANRKLDVPLSHSNGTAESVVMNSEELSTSFKDHQEICYWGYHSESNATAMSAWLKPVVESSQVESGHVVYMIRDRARVVLSYDANASEGTDDVPVEEIRWLIHNGRERGYLAPADTSWTNDKYYAEGRNSSIISKAGIHEYKTCGRYSLWISDDENDDDNFDLAYPYPDPNDEYGVPQFLFDDDNADIDNIKVILKVRYSGRNNPVYHVLRLNNDEQEKYDIVRNNTYYIKCSRLSPDVAFYNTLEEAVNGTDFVNADVEVDRTIPDINNDKFTLQIKLPNEGTSIVLNREGNHDLDFVFRKVSDLSEGSVNPEDFDVYWEKNQSFCTDPTLSYVEATKQFMIHTTVIQGKITNQLQSEWIVVKHKASGLTRYIHVYVIDQFRYILNPTLKAVSGTNDYVLSFQLPKPDYTDPDNPDPTEKIYPASLYPIDVKFTTNTLNAYGITQGSTTEYGLFGVSVESTAGLVTVDNFEAGYNSPVSSTATSDMSHWYYQQGGNKFWDFWYTYSLKAYPTDGKVNIYFKDVRDHIKYATVRDVGLFMYVEYFGKNYSVPVTN